ncbi:hypothetical protein GO613_00470 [Azoarcus communis]|uniref:hypothetical protein n=1 Tax=Parazoarcus communis TaxID=41977 RepID=UPI001459D47F|nr:hypothetical protein [Parazoarcus communis]NMG46583.1 hypothetical protein [Parazoarcus communis]
MQPFKSAVETIFERAREGLTMDELKELSNLTELASDEARRLSEVCSNLGCLVSMDGQSDGTKAGTFQHHDDVSTLLFALAHSFETVSTMASIGDSATYHLHERMAKHGEVKP